MTTPAVTPACEACPVHNAEGLVRLGVKMDNAEFVVALAGNPNTGKSTVFNALTGLHQHTGNWPGKTVTRAEGGFSFSGKRYKLVDLPGTYSLLSTSTDEEVARNFILFAQPDVTLVVVDASRLERNLNLVLQILEITDRVVVCLNLIDEAARHGIQVDERTLSRELGIPVVPSVARHGTGIQDLLQAMHDVVSGAFTCKPFRIQHYPPHVEKAINELVPILKQLFPDLSAPRWVALRLLEGDATILESVRTGELLRRDPERTLLENLNQRAEVLP
jgi:Fe2+ transport system protein B